MSTGSDDRLTSSPRQDTLERQELVRVLYDVRSGRHEHRGANYDGDFHGLLGAAREAGPVHGGSVAATIGAPYGDYLVGSDENHYSCYSWDACWAAFADNETFASDVYLLGEVARAKFGGSLIAMGGVEHRRRRALVHATFVKKHSRWWIDRFVGGIVDRLLDEIVADGRCDLNLQLCALLPLYTITSSFGIDEDDALVLSDLVNRVNRADPPPAETAARIDALLLPLVEERRARPADDLLSVLVRSELVDDDGAHALDDAELVAFARLLITAGISTTWQQLGILLYLVLRDRALYDAVRRDPGLLAQVVEEMLRWEGQQTLMRRHVTADTVLCGTELPRGSILELCMAAANRDPSRWERPDEFDVHRPRKPHLTFGGGPHICLGMHVARAELLTAAEKVLERLPNVRFDPDGEPPRVIGFEGRHIQTLPVVWDA